EDAPSQRERQQFATVQEQWQGDGGGDRQQQNPDNGERDAGEERAQATILARDAVLAGAYLAHPRGQQNGDDGPAAPRDQQARDADGESDRRLIPFVRERSQAKR